MLMGIWQPRTSGTNMKAWAKYLIIWQHTLRMGGWGGVVVGGTESILLPVPVEEWWDEVGEVVCACSCVYLHRNWLVNVINLRLFIPHQYGHERMKSNKEVREVFLSLKRFFDGKRWHNTMGDNIFSVGKRGWVANGRQEKVAVVIIYLKQRWWEVKRSLDTAWQDIMYICPGWWATESQG